MRPPLSLRSWLTNGIKKWTKMWVWWIAWTRFLARCLKRRLSRSIRRRLERPWLSGGSDSKHDMVMNHLLRSLASRKGSLKPITSSSSKYRKGLPQKVTMSCRQMWLRANRNQNWILPLNKLSGRTQRSTKEWRRSQKSRKTFGHCSTLMPPQNRQQRQPKSRRTRKIRNSSKTTRVKPIWSSKLLHRKRYNHHNHHRSSSPGQQEKKSEKRT